jgi:glycine betaine catabolism B
MEEDFVKVAETKDVQASQMMAVEVNGEKVCIANVEGRYYAIGLFAHIWMVLLQRTK